MSEKRMCIDGPKNLRPPWYLLGSDQTAKQDVGHLYSFFYLFTHLSTSHPAFLASQLTYLCIFSLSQVTPFHAFYFHVSSLRHSDAEEEGELEPAKELIQPIAEKLMAKYKAKEEETPLLFFVAGEVR